MAREVSADGTAWAELSEDKRYRYLLGRRVGPGNKRVLFVMLNPSTADALKDDPTIRRCKGFAQSWGYDVLEVVNLYSYRTPYPKELFNQQGYWVGEDNVFWQLTALKQADLVVCAWGANVAQDECTWQHFVQVAHDFGYKLFCLGTTKNGHPKHPLRLAKTTPLASFLS